MKKITTMALIFAVLLLPLAFAAGDEVAQGKALVDSRISCDTATDEQLELIGDYLMEQMHPGKAHEYMDSMMGGEGSESLRQAHIQMAQVIYCGRTDTPMTYGGMMGMMPMMTMMGRYAASGNAASGGMMGSFGGMMNAGNYGYGMMGGFAQGSLLQEIFWLLGIVALALAIIWLYQQVSGRKAKR